MNSKIEQLHKKMQSYKQAIPPGQFYEYDAGHKTYICKEQDGKANIADNPYILEYLVYNGREEEIPIVSNLVYDTEELVEMKTSKNNSIFFEESLFYMLEFEATMKELPLFKVFLDHLMWNRKQEPLEKNGITFPWSYREFEKYVQPRTNNLTDGEIKNLHDRLVEFQKEKRPEESIKSLFGGK